MEHGLTTTDPAVSDLKRTVMGIARRKVFVGTHIKFGLSSFSRFADVEELDVLVTGSALASRTAGHYQASGVRIVRACRPVRLQVQQRLRRPDIGDESVDDAASQ